MNAPRRHAWMLAALALPVALGSGACASVRFDRRTETSGTFESTGWAFTIGKIDLPGPALQIAYENASDSNLANMRVEQTVITPDWGYWNWILDIISVRRARIRGTWGFDAAEGAPAGG